MTDHPFKFQPEHDGSLTVESAVYREALLERIVAALLPVESPQILGYSVVSEYPGGGHLESGVVHPTPALAEGELLFLQRVNPGPRVYRVVEIRAWTPGATA